MLKNQNLSRVISYYIMNTDCWGIQSIARVEQLEGSDSTFFLSVFEVISFNQNVILKPVLDGLGGNQSDLQLVLDDIKIYNHNILTQVTSLY